MIQNLNIKDFLNVYWQKKPLLIRNAFPDYQSPVSAEELAGLACEDFIESRIISEHITSPKWRLENGPFKESKFSELPQSHWTLLIQGLNKILPEFDDLLHEFNFIPSWRVDDVMASFAVVEGSVGPHIDQYDVFLLQAYGHRKWMISEQEIRAENLEPGLPLKIINNFKTESEWILGPGDMLYLPPNVAHYGVALDDCMTFSIGFRAPSHAELISSYVDEYLPMLKDELRYQDADLEYNENCGEISSDAINKVYAIFQSHFNDKARIKDWFGCFITDYLNNDEDLQDNDLTAEEFLSELKNTEIRRPATVRANYMVDPSGMLTLYINGETRSVNSETCAVARLYCNHHHLTYEDLKPYITNQKSVKFLTELYNMGYLEFMDSNEDINKYE